MVEEGADFSHAGGKSEAFHSFVEDLENAYWPVE